MKSAPNALHLPNCKMLFIIFAKFGIDKLKLKVSKQSVLPEKDIALLDINISKHKARRQGLYFV
jgi:hypothetical protein